MNKSQLESFLAEQIKTCPIPVLRTEVNKFVLANLKKFSKKSQSELLEQSWIPCDASFFYLTRAEAKRMKTSRRFIVLQHSGSVARDIGNLFHEIGHHECYRRHCECSCNSAINALSEYHAESYALSRALRTPGLSPVVKYIVNNNCADCIWTEKAYEEAARLLREKKLWKEGRRRLLFGR